jgi:IS5 family transposase
VSRPWPVRHPRPGAAGNPYDGHTLARIVPAIEELVGNEIERLHADAGYRGHNAKPDYQFKVYTSKQKRRLNADPTRDAAPLCHRAGDWPSQERASHGAQLPPPSPGRCQHPILAAVGYNFRLLMRWLRILLCLLLAAILAPPKSTAL